MTYFRQTDDEILQTAPRRNLYTWTIGQASRVQQESTQHQITNILWLLFSNGLLHQLLPTSLGINIIDQSTTRFALQQLPEGACSNTGEKSHHNWWNLDTIMSSIRRYKDHALTKKMNHIKSLELNRRDSWKIGFRHQSTHQSYARCYNLGSHTILNSI